ncbi:PAS domain S-box protein [Haliea sp. E1-2-M8]|uniref:PAS domain S-box protein n=1 Tax=Haliea sp. E1-2-M8 TaxID=3064706 RepID=UPI00271608D3|nr:PAS domain S-box protein [Haliea sp. E1-2-M8]MDO8863680.1 PAS domain S-box protein [Haliea sp. E1-2-M8]
MNTVLNESLFFAKHPDAMWIYDLESLAFLEVNDAAIARYGYTRPEFLSMSIRDIRPEEDIPALDARVRQHMEGLDQAGTWRHRTKSGRVIHVDVSSHALVYQDVKAKLVSVRDVTRLVEMERDRALSVAREQELRQQAEASAVRFRSLFESSPEKMLVLNPDDLSIIAASNNYLEATLTARDDIQGKYIFDVFPDDPSEPLANSTSHLRSSLDRVMATLAVDVMPLHLYPIPLPAELGGGFQERYWSVVNTPVAGPDGQVVYIIHRVEDVTQIVSGTSGSTEVPGIQQNIGDHRFLDVLLRSRELHAINVRLREQEAHLNTAKRLAGLGIWKLNIDTGCLEGSENLITLYGVDLSKLENSLEGYLSVVHPDDRSDILVNIQNYVEKPSSHFTFGHRIFRPSGEIIYVRGIGELTFVDGNRILTGVVQDITAELESASRLVAATNLEKIAGQYAHLGGWRADFASGMLEWSDETAAIHEVEQNNPIPVSEGINFYSVEHRDRIGALFTACVEEGEPYDEVSQIITAKGRRVWVRAIGQPEYDDAGAIIAVRGAFQDITDLVEVREQSEQLSRQLRQTLEQTSDAVLMLNREFEITYLNPQTERLLQKASVEAENRHISDVFEETASAPFMVHYESAVSRRQSVHFTEFFAPLDMWIEVDAYPVPEGLALYFRDVTSRRKRDEQLRLLESAVSHQNDILLITEAESIDEPYGPKIVYANDALTRITGFTPGEVVGKTPRIFQGPGTQRSELARIRSALENGEGVRAELINYSKSGDELWLEVDIIPLTDEQGTTRHFVAVERDITQRKLMEQAALVSDERFRLVAKAANDVIWDWDLVKDTLWWSEGLEEQFGYLRSEIEPGGESWSNRIQAEDSSAVLSSIHAVIEGQDTIWQQEYRFLHANGKALTVIDRGFVIRDLFGTAVRMVGSMRDITESRKVAGQLRQAQKLEAVGQLTGGVAHDFNNLLTVILGNAELLQEQLTDQEQLRLLAEMTVSAAQRGAELTNRLLAFARRQALEPRRINVDSLMAGMETLLRRTLSADIDFQLNHSAELWAAEIDPGQLETALLNLVINSRDAMPDGGRLTLEAVNIAVDGRSVTSHHELVPGHYVLLSVSDTGLGMTEKVSTRAFEPFFTTKPPGKGSGLGLSMVYGFVKQSGGHLQVFSEQGEGTTIKLYFPRAVADEGEVYPSVTQSMTQGGQEHILVVEDDHLVRNHVITLLAGLGYQVSIARSGQEAIDILASATGIDLLFTDVVMSGGMNGRQLAEAASVLNPRLKVLFTSGYNEDAIIHHGRLDPGIDLLSKPYRRQELAAKVRKVLEDPGHI